jgi:hypothetical protein
MKVGIIAHNITTILLKCMVKYGKVLDEEFGSRWVCLVVMKISCSKDITLG